MKIYPDQEVQIATLIAHKAFVTIPADYSDLEDVFFQKSTAVLSELIKINTYAINLEEGKQLLYGPIYSLGLVELKILKTYIEINLANDFICLSKSSAGLIQ